MLVIHNAKIHTLNPPQPTAQAAAIDGSRIVACGPDEQILSAFPSAVRCDALGLTILPGLTDAHLHLEDYAFSQQKIDCETATRDECLKKVAARARDIQPGEWILGHGWNQNTWDEGYGSAAMLDQVAPDNPVYLTHKSLHSAWANTLALKQAGITRNSTNPVGGEISHLTNGEPGGILFESATGLIEKVIPEPSLSQVVKAIEATIHTLWRMGLTGVHDFDGARCFSALQQLHSVDELRLRVVKSIPRENLTHAITLGLRTGFGDDLLRIGNLKLFADGALGPQTAAMLTPYESDTLNTGMLMMEADELFEIGRQAVENGISLAIHAIGDRANRQVLNAYSKLREFERSLPLTPSNGFRHRIEHVQVLHPDDLPRFAQLNIIASMQPIHATSDMLMADKHWGIRSKYAYAWNSLLADGANLTFGSDAPVESPNPFWGIHAAVTRRRVDGSPGPDGWYPEQRLSVDQAIHGFTLGAAFAAGMQDRLGMLAPGFLADLVVIDQDPYTCDPDALRVIKPMATMLGGEWVFSEI